MANNYSPTIFVHIDQRIITFASSPFISSAIVHRRFVGRSITPRPLSVDTLLVRLTTCRSDYPLHDRLPYVFVWPPRNVTNVYFVSRAATIGEGTDSIFADSTTSRPYHNLGWLTERQSSMSKCLCTGGTSANV